MNPILQHPRMTPRRRAIWFRAGALATVHGPVRPKTWTCFDKNSEIHPKAIYRGSIRGRATSTRKVLSITRSNLDKDTRTDLDTRVEYQVIRGMPEGAVRESSLPAFRQWAKEVHS